VTARDVVFTFTFETWSDAVARGMARPPDRLALTLLEHPEVRRLIVGNPPRNALRRAAKLLTGRRDAPFPGDDRHRLVTPLRWGGIDPVSIEGLQRQGAGYDRALKRAARRAGMDRPVVITASPFAAGYGRFDWAPGALYYARDDWSELPGRRPWWPAIREGYRRIRENAMPVAAVSQAILDRIEPRGPSLVVPNGVEPQEWAGDTPAAPDWLAAIPGPRALYVGILDSRLDLDGLRELSARRPELQIVLLGEFGEPEMARALAELPSIHVHGPVGRAELVAAVRNVDVCLVSHVRTPLTEAMSPLKIYEYLAGGSPVLSIDLPPVRGIDPRVVLTDTTAEFADALDTALALGRAPEPERLAFVAANSWRSRHDAILRAAFEASA
jgi:teichuronic acid biosynthesis glycosyltransferase TuaH